MIVTGHSLPPPCCIINNISVHNAIVPIQATSIDPGKAQALVSWSLGGLRLRRKQTRQDSLGLELTVIPPELLINSESGV